MLPRVQEQALTRHEKSNGIEQIADLLTAYLAELRTVERYDFSALFNVLDEFRDGLPKTLAILKKMDTPLRVYRELESISSLLDQYIPNKLAVSANVVETLGWEFVVDRAIESFLIRYRNIQNTGTWRTEGKGRLLRVIDELHRLFKVNSTHSMRPQRWTSTDRQS